MGVRGPIPGAIRSTPGPKADPERAQRLGRAPRRPRASRPAMEVFAPDRPAPEPPSTLDNLGRQVWRDVFEGLPTSVLNPQLDHLAVRRLCELVDLRATLHVVMVKAPILSEPIVSPRGDVVGERVVLNPVAGALKAVDKQIDALSDRLALSPAARARLGLTVSKAQQAQADATSILDRMYRKEGA